MEREIDGWKLVEDKKEVKIMHSILKLISDNFQKIIIVKDNIISHHNDDGILFVNLFDFLLNKFQL